MRRTPMRIALSALATTALEATLLAIGVGGPAALLPHHRALARLAIGGAGGATLAAVRPPATRDVVERPAGQGALLAGLLLVPLVTPMRCALAERFALWPLPGGAALRWGGVALAAGGLALRIAAMAQLGSRFAPVVALQRGHALETRGLYGVVRHPGYLGAWLGSLGAVLAFGSAAGLACAVAFALAIAARVRAEETMLARAFGDDWRAYAVRTARWWPRPGRRLAPP